MQFEDTHPEVKRVWIEMLRQASSAKKFALVGSWSQFILDAARQNIRKEQPEASEEEIKLLLVARLYGKPLADKVRAELERRRYR